MEQPEGVAATDEDCLRPGDPRARIGVAVDRFERDAHRREPRGRLGRVGVPIEERKRDEERGAHGPQQGPQPGLDMIEVAAAVLGGVADQKQVPGHGGLLTGARGGTVCVL